MSQELHTFIVPDGGIQLEWLSSEERIDKSRQLLEKEYSGDLARKSMLFFFFRGLAINPSLFPIPSISGTDSPDYSPKR